MSYDKDDVKNVLTFDDIMNILDFLGAEPEDKGDVIVCRTICHGGHSKKLYYYSNTKMFHCYTGCQPASFDIFELLKKVRGYDLNTAILYVIRFFNLEWKIDEVDNLLSKEDWNTVNRYKELSEIKVSHEKIKLPQKEINLEHYPKPHILNWEKEGITKEVCDYMNIHYDPTIGAIIIPHTDEDGNIIGVRQRTLIKSEEDKGKYRPWKHGSELLNHPLAFNLYGYHEAKDTIRKMGLALVFEGEKAVMQYLSYFGLANDLAVAVCGSNISKYQMNMLVDGGAKEVCVGFDADWEHPGDEKWKQVVAKWQKIYDKYNGKCNLSFLYDSTGELIYNKMSPTDAGKDVFLELWRNRIFL